MKKSFYKSTVLSALILAAFPTCAKAQSINYGALQTLFGEPVTTSATGKPQRVSEAPVDMTIITSDDIRKSGAKDIAEVLRGTTGVNIIQSGRQNYDVGIRGYNQPYSTNILVLVNGRQVYLDDYGYVNWSAIPVQLQEIRQIEVVKGPNTALFGFNAADGVINIVTMNPLYDSTSNIGVTGGTDEYRDISIVKSLKINDTIGIRISAGASKAHEFRSQVNPAEPDIIRQDPEKNEVNIDTIFQVTPKSQLRLEASNSETKQTEMTPVFIATKAYYETNSLKATYTADTDYGLVEATAYKNFLDTSLGTSMYNLASAADIKENVVVAQLGDTFKPNPSNTFRVMGEYRHNRANGSLFGPQGSFVQDDVYGLSGMWNWAINKSWSWTNSARVDRLQLSRSGTFIAGSPQTDAMFDRNITKPSYNSGLVWKVTDDDSLRLNTGRGVRMGSFFDFDSSVSTGATLFGFPVIDIGVPNVSPTYVTNYELGWNHRVQPINGTFKADVFTAKTTQQTSVSANIVASPFAPPFPPAFIAQGNGNIGWSRAIGAELELDGKIDKNWSWGINDTLERIQDHYSDATNTKDRTPKNITNAHIGYQNGPWEADAYVYYTTRIKQPLPSANFLIPIQDVAVPAHVSLSARTAYTLPDGTIVALSGQELQKTQSETSTGLKTERRVFLSVDHPF
jgi:outer membrane receptor for ferrienterochelin and colicins